MVNPIPDDYPRANASLAIDGAAEAIEFYTNVLGFESRLQIPFGPDKIAHAELQLGDSLIMLADEIPEANWYGPEKYGGSPVSLHVYVEDVDATFAAAISAGATLLKEPEDQFYGDRQGQFLDPWGHRWAIASKVEDVSPEELEARLASMGD